MKRLITIILIVLLVILSVSIIAERVSFRQLDFKRVDTGANDLEIIFVNRNWSPVWINSYRDTVRVFSMRDSDGVFLYGHTVDDVARERIPHGAEAIVSVPKAFAPEEFLIEFEIYNWHGRTIKQSINIDVRSSP